MLFNARIWPNSLGWYDEGWAPAFCFVGNIVGMFAKDRQTYIVGRIHESNRKFEDQVYTMSATDNMMVDINVLVSYTLSANE